MGRAYEVRKASIQKTWCSERQNYIGNYAKEIYLAAKGRSPELESNVNLKQSLVEKAKKEQVPSGHH